MQFLVSGRPKAKSLILPKIDNGRPHYARPAPASVLPATHKKRISLNHADPLTLELAHGSHKQSVQLPTESLDRSKKYFVTFTLNRDGEHQVEDVIKAPAKRQGKSRSRSRDHY